MPEGESQNGSYKRTKQAKFSEKLSFLTPLLPMSYAEISKFSFLSSASVGWNIFVNHVGQDESTFGRTQN